MTSTAKPDYWSILGLDQDSDLQQLKSAFRKEARKWHPDLNKDDSSAEERFKLINEAYAVLSDPKKRVAWESNSDFKRSDDDLFAEGFPSYEEYISLVLGIENDTEIDQIDNISYEQQVDDESYVSSNEYWPTPSEVPPPPVKLVEDLESIVELTVDEALNGSQVEVELDDGTIVEIRTPKFAGDGWRLRLAGIAFSGKDHFIQLRVQTSEGLRIDGLRVNYRLELLPPEALLGCAVEVPTLNGYVTLQVPPRSSSGRLLRLRGRGLNYEDITGDQYVEIVIIMPNELTDSELALYRRLHEISNQTE
ncbi:DnaJ domain-containing protein [Prochlorococcus sp. MIT 1223]|uniref:DnaJ domain-containing protein n=1 Tax=Prochlorococcus sp. MIT 1223 TaxID=3096217 RepID=UPI002A75CF90|nr:DnaJ domain-containing protein [Prochlorococcus sp. MIT 1223]